MKVLVLLTAIFAVIIMVSAGPLPYPRVQRVVPLGLRAKRASLPVDSPIPRKPIESIEAEEPLEGSESAYPPYYVYPYYISHLPVVYLG